MGKARSGVAEVDATTGIATSWNPTADNIVRGLVVIGTTVYVGGDFTNVGHEDRYGLAALDAGTGAALSWSPMAGGVGQGNVITMASKGDSVFVGGEFSILGQNIRNRVAAWTRQPAPLSTGIPTPTAPSSTSRSPVAPSTPPGHLPRSEARRARTSPRWMPRPEARPRGTRERTPPSTTLTQSGSQLYANGFFTSIGGQPRNQVAALDAASGSVTPWNPNVNGGVSRPGAGQDAPSTSAVSSLPSAGEGRSLAGGNRRWNGGGYRLESERFQSGPQSLGERQPALCGRRIRQRELPVPSSNRFVRHRNRRAHAVETRR